jgi:5-methylthioadenosine/S-adenosylhomocysteine deaminase
MRTLIRGGWIVGFTNGHHTLIENGCVLVEGNKISFVGKQFSGEVDLTIDANGKLVSPGFIDTHVHAGHRASHKLITDVGRKDFYGQPFLETSIPREGKRVAGEPRFLRPGENTYATDIDGPAEFTLVELLRNGVTTFVEFGSALPVQMALLKLLRQYGLRAYLGPGYDSGRWVADDQGRLKRVVDEDSGLKGFAEALDFILRHEGEQDGRIRGALMPREFETCTAELLDLTHDAAAKHGLPMGSHVAFSVLEFHETVRAHRKTPIECLHDHGLLCPTFNIGHGNYISDTPLVNYAGGQDLQLMGQNNVTVSHCSTNLARRGRSLYSWDKYLRAGVNLTLGSDTYPRDMIMNMRIASYMGKMTDRNFAVATAAEVFNAATVGGARSLGRNDLGRIAEGALADIIIVDLSGRDSLRHGVVRDPIKALVECGVGDDVETVMVDGIIRMKDRNIVGCELEALRARMQEAAVKVWQSWQESDPLGRTADEMSPFSFPLQ